MDVNNIGKPQHKQDNAILIHFKCWLKKEFSVWEKEENDINEIAIVNKSVESKNVILNIYSKLKRKKMSPILIYKKKKEEQWKIQDIFSWKVNILCILPNWPCDFL